MSKISHVGKIGQHTRFTSINLERVDSISIAGLNAWATAKINGRSRPFRVFIPHDIADKQGAWDELIEDVDLIGVWLPFGYEQHTFYVLQMNVIDEAGKARQYNAVDLGNQYIIHAAVALDVLSFADLVGLAHGSYRFEVLKSSTMKDMVLVEYEYSGHLKPESIAVVM